MFRTHALVRLGVLASVVAGGYLIASRFDHLTPNSSLCETGFEARVLGQEPATALEATTSVTWEPGGRLMATGRRDGSVCLWGPDGTPAGQWVALDAPVNAVRFVGDHSTLLTAGRDGVVRLWDLSGAAPTVRVEVRAPAPVLSAAASRDGKTLAIGHLGAISLWRAAPGQLTPVGRLNTPSYLTCALAFAPDGRTLAAGSSGDGWVRLWRLGDESEPECLDSSDNYQVRALNYSTDGRTLLALDTDGHVICWDLGDRRRTAHRLGLPTVRDGAFEPGGRRVLVANFDGVSRIATAHEVAFPLGMTSGTRE